MFLCDYIQTPIGQMLAGATSEGVCMLHFADIPDISDRISRIETVLNAKAIRGKNIHLLRLEQELQAYFRSNLNRFSVSLRLLGTDFQLKVFESLTYIPHGRNFSYADFAEILDMPKSVRAIAAAIGQNNISVVVPCHRVVGSDGRLTGYSGGLWRKNWLLQHEKSISPCFNRLPFSHEDLQFNRK